MKAIFINAMERKVELVEIGNTLEAMYEKIGCEMIEVVEIGAGHGVICDEEGRCRNWAMGFNFGGATTIAGNALIVRLDDEGDFADAVLPVELFSSRAVFVDLKAHPLPPPRIGFAFIEGELNARNIAKARARAEQDLNEQE